MLGNAFIQGQEMLFFKHRVVIKIPAEGNWFHDCMIV